MPNDVQLLMAHRYRYYVMAAPVISDYDYDQMEARVLSALPEIHPLRAPGSDRESDYDEATKALARSL